MDLFLTDRVSTQYVMEPLLRPIEPRPYEEDAEFQWIFEICKIVQPAASEMTVSDLMDAFLVSLEFEELDEIHQSRFREVGRAEADSILTYLLSHDLVHGRQIAFSETRVVTLVERLFTLFSSHPRYFTNGEFDLHAKPFGLKRWYPITSHTFDTGLILVDEQRIGIFWEVAED